MVLVFKQIIQKERERQKEKRKKNLSLAEVSNSCCFTIATVLKSNETLFELFQHSIFLFFPLLLVFFVGAIVVFVAVAMYAVWLLLTDADFTFSLKRRAKRAHAQSCSNIVQPHHTAQTSLPSFPIDPPASELSISYHSAHTHTPIKCHKREQRNDRGHYHTVMVLTHLNSLAKVEKDGFTADTMGQRNLYSTFPHKHSRCVILPDLCCRLYYNAWRVCVRRIKHSLTLTLTSSVKRKTVSRGDQCGSKRLQSDEDTGCQ